MRRISEVFINGVCLEEILEDHKRWLNNNGGKRAILRYADLSYVSLIGVDLRGANLNCIDLRGSVLKGADLRNADLSYAILRDADLKCADLRGANLNKVLYNHQTSFFSLACPEEGSFFGYNKADDKIVKLLITEDSKRSSATTRKCRCSKAKVFSITDIENTEEFSEVSSNRDSYFIYKVGEIVEVKDFDDDRWNECSTGIHFFITRDEAVIY